MGTDQHHFLPRQQYLSLREDMQFARYFYPHFWTEVWMIERGNTLRTCCAEWNLFCRRRRQAILDVIDSAAIAEGAFMDAG